MTPEERNRAIEFIIQSQARLAAAQERDRQERIDFQQHAKEMDARLARISEETTRLLNHQSERMDRLDKFYDNALKQTGEFHKQTIDLEKQALYLLNLILDRLPLQRPEA